MRTASGSASASTSRAISSSIGSITTPTATNRSVSHDDSDSQAFGKGGDSRNPLSKYTAVRSNYRIDDDDENEGGSGSPSYRPPAYTPAPPPVSTFSSFASSMMSSFVSSTTTSLASVGREIESVSSTHHNVAVTGGDSIDQEPLRLYAYNGEDSDEEEGGGRAWGGGRYGAR